MTLDALFPEVAFNNEHDTVVTPQERGPALKPCGSPFPILSLRSALLFLVSARVCASRLVSVECERARNAPASWYPARAPWPREAGSRLGCLQAASFLFKVPFII